MIDSSLFEIIIKGMQEVVEDEELGTSNIAKMENISVCGKTGTAQNPHGEDHSIFIGFAPKNNPKIALAMGYYGIDAKELMSWVILNKGVFTSLLKSGGRYT